MHKICTGRTPLRKETLLEWRTTNPDIRGEVSDYLCNEMMAVRTNIDDLLKSMGLPREYIAKSTGMDVTHLSMWFSHKARNLSPAAVAAFSGIFHCTCSEILLGEKKPVNLPKRTALFYETISKSSKANKAAEKLLAGTASREPQDATVLIYERLMELVEDDMNNLEDFMEICKPEYRLNLKQLLKEKRFIARLPAIFGMCILTDISPDFLLLQDYTESPLIANGKKVEDKYLRTISKFVNLSSDDQDAVLGNLLLQML
ncbi:MAG: hypothetical protein II038_02260 [Lachnospiraceae bacterium]|nr:hypothetical protein [Lachnospiraceae bacterium]